MVQNSITLGIFNHLFIVSTLSVVSLVILIVLFWLVKRQYLSQIYKFLAYSFAILALHWATMTAQLFYAGQGEIVLSKGLFYASFTILTVAIASFLYFALSVVYSKLSYIQKGSAAIILGILPGLSLYFTELIHNGVTVWDSSWLISTITLIAFGILTIIPITMSLLLLFIHAFDDGYKDKHLERLVMKVGSIFLILYFFITFVDYYMQMNGWATLWLRLGLLGLLFLFLLIILHKRLRTYGFKVDVRLRNPLMVKGIFYSLFTTIFPLVVAAYFLTISFRAIIDALVGEEMYSASLVLEQQVIMTSIVLGFLSFFVSLLIMKILENKIKRIIQGMYEVLNNNFEYRIKNAKPYDELGSLSLSFNDMAKDLDGYSIEIDKYSDILEHKVESRTKELEDKSLEAKKIIDEINKNSESLSHQTDRITDQMQDGLLVLDGNNSIQRYNQAFVNIFQLEKEGEYHNQAFLGLGIIQEYSEFKTMLDKFHAENLETYQQKITLKPPLSGMLECRLTRFDIDDEQKGVILILRDISLPWGVVYDAESKEPVPSVVVRLYNEANNKIIAEETTDDVGRFMFYVNPGNYYVRLFKDGYNFPSKAGIGYHGEVITIEDKKDSVIHFDVLIDKLG